MKLIIQHRLHQPSDAFTALVESELAALATLMRIDEARILIERQQDKSPPFRISAHLVTPGPDVMAEATDHTLRAALTKLVRSMRNKILRRSRRARPGVSSRFTSLSA